MKIDFIKKGSETRLILIFAGWSTDARYYVDCVADGWDTAVVSDYRDLSMPSLPEQYSTIYLFAYSLGVWAASQCQIDAAARIAVCGTPVPVSVDYGIPDSIFLGTAAGLTSRTLMKFHLRMAGDKALFDKINTYLPPSPDIESLQEELYSIASQSRKNKLEYRWDKVFIADNDRIIPSQNQVRYWSQFPDVVKVMLKSSHAVDLKKIIDDCLPDCSKIGEGFGKAVSTYNDNAVVQAEICERIGAKLRDLLTARDTRIDSLLEIGVGNGLLTDVWRKTVVPRKADFVDLIEMRKFGIAEEERYFITDAEEWMMNSSDKYDLILSSSAIQWFADPVKFIKTVKSHLNPGGIAIISTFVKGNLHQLDAVRPCPLIYHSVEEYREIPGIKTEEWESTLTFPSSREMLMHLRHTGVSPRRNSTAIHLSDMPAELTYHPLILTITA